MQVGIYKYTTSDHKNKEKDKAFSNLKHNDVKRQNKNNMEDKSRMKETATVKLISEISI